MKTNLAFLFLSLSLKVAHYKNSNCTMHKYQKQKATSSKFTINYVFCSLCQKSMYAKKSVVLLDVTVVTHAKFIDTFCCKYQSAYTRKMVLQKELKKKLSFLYVCIASSELLRGRCFFSILSPCVESLPSEVLSLRRTNPVGVLLTFT